MSDRKRVISVVLAGGFGTRLFPLTETKPKPLVKILDTSVLENVICAVKKTSVGKIIVSTFYKTDMIEKKCREIDEKIVCKKEKTPLGTAGGVKNCCDGEYDAVLVVSGDAVFDFALQDAIDFHFENRNDVTVVTSHKDNPTEYGVVISDECGNIIRFDEKPSWKRVRSDCVNTGIYVISKSVVDEIPLMKTYDFSKNLFPKLMKEGRKMQSFPASGFWCDIGTHEEYFTCNILAANGKISCIANDGRNYENLNRKGIHAEQGAYVSKDAKIGKNVRINCKSIVCSGAIIGDNSDISCSIISENAVVGKGCSINEAIIGEGTAVGENCIVPEGVVIGDRSRISDGTVIRRNTYIGAEKTVTGKEMAQMDFFGKTHIFKEDGKAVFEDVNVCRKLCDMAQALSISYQKSQNGGVSIAVMCSNDCSYLKDTFSGVLASQNNTVFDCNEGNIAMLSFAVKKLDLDLGVFLRYENENISLTILSDNGSVIDEEAERKISRVYSSISCEGQTSSSGVNMNGKIVNIPVRELYKNSLEKYFSKMLSNTHFDGMKLCIPREQTERNATASVLCKIFEQAGIAVTVAGTKEMINVSVSEDGTRACVRCKNMIVDHEHLCAIILKNSDILGLGKVNLGNNAPMVLKSLVSNGKNDMDDAFSIICDGGTCLASFIALLGLRGYNLEELFLEIPLFEIYTDEFIADINRGATMERLSRFYHDSKADGDDGIRLCLAEGNVTVIPNRAKGFKIISEAQSMEAAKELSVKIGKVIKN